MTQLEQAIELVKANGYRVTKIRAKAAPKPKAIKLAKKHQKGPTCVVHWADGQITRMSICCDPKALNFERGIKVSTAAWQTRQRRPIGRRLAELQKLINRDNKVTPKQREAAAAEYAELLAVWIAPPTAKAPEIVDCYFVERGNIIGVWPESTHSLPVDVREFVEERLAA